jgi:hypothetical protein
VSRIWSTHTLLLHVRHDRVHSALVASSLLRWTRSRAMFVGRQLYAARVSVLCVGNGLDEVIGRSRRSAGADVRVGTTNGDVCKRMGQPRDTRMIIVRRAYLPCDGRPQRLSDVPQDQNIESYRMGETCRMRRAARSIASRQWPPNSPHFTMS